MRVVVLAAEDEVGVCVDGVPAGVTLHPAGRAPVTANQAIQAGHKIALVDLDAGAAVHKYGQQIGVTSAPVAAGDHVHVHNLASARAGGSRG